MQSQKHLKNSSKVKDEDPIKVINESELNSQRFLQLKKRCKKVKRNIEQKSLEYEKNFLKNENVTSDNKKRLTKLILDLEIVVSQQKKDYQQIQRVLQEFNRILDKFHEPDLAVIRSTRFVSIFMELAKGSHIVPKFELNDFIKVLEGHLGIL